MDLLEIVIFKNKIRNAKKHEILSKLNKYTSVNALVQERLKLWEFFL